MVFDRILVGVDDSDGGRAALAQALVLLAPGGELVAVSVCEEALAALAGPGAPRAAAELHRAAEAAHEDALSALAGRPGTSARLVRGRPADALLSLARSEAATLVAVGTRGHRRASGILLGSIETRLLHEAPCAVLVARVGPEPERFPHRIVVGVDDSPCSLEALQVASDLGGRLGAEVVVAQDVEPAVDGLVAAAAGADLLVVGSRGLHGVKALGSVSERVAHRARCSVLVVR